MSSSLGSKISLAELLYTTEKWLKLQEIVSTDKTNFDCQILTLKKMPFLTVKSVFATAMILNGLKFCWKILFYQKNRFPED